MIHTLFIWCFISNFGTFEDDGYNTTKIIHISLHTHALSLSFCTMYVKPAFGEYCNLLEYFHKQNLQQPHENTSYEVLTFKLGRCLSFHIFVIVESRCNEGPWDRQNMFAITRFHYFEIFSIYFSIAGSKDIFRYTEEFVISKFHCSLLYTRCKSWAWIIIFVDARLEIIEHVCSGYCVVAQS